MSRCSQVPSYTANYTHAKRVRICCHNTDHVHVNGHDRIILVIFSQALYKSPWWWILCDPKHVGVHFFDVLLTVYLSLFISVINQLDAQHFYFTIILFHSSTFFEHIIRWPSLARDGHPQVWWYQRLYNTILTSLWRAHVLETCRGMK